MMSRLTIRNTGRSRLRTVALLALLTAVMLISAAPSAALAQQAPGHVGSVSVTRSNGSLTASWNAPAGATRYHVTYTSDNKKSWQLAALNHASTSITISGVDNKKVYYVAARAGNANGWGPWRDSAPAAPYKPPTDPVDPLDPPTSVTLTRADGTITATWPAVSEATSYHVGYSVDLGLTWYRNRVFYTKTSLTFKADNSLTYIVSVMSVDGDEQSEWRESAPIAPYVPPVGRPASVTVTRVDGILRVSWDAASGATHYHITYTSDHKKSWSLSSLNHKSTSITITGVDNAKTYYVAVRGRSGNTFGAWRDSAAAGPFGPTPTPAPTPTATPLAPPANLAVAPGSGYLDITWDASTGATGYDVRVKPENASDWTTVASNITGTSYNYTTTQTIDWVGVRARNSGGTSAWTDISRLPSNDLMATYTGASIQSASAASAGASAQSNDVSAQAKLAAPTFTKTQRSINRFNAEINLNWNSVDFAGGYNLACTDTDGWAWHACGWDNSGTLKYSSVASTDTRPVKVTHYRRKAGEGTHTPGDYALIMGRHYEVAVRAVNANPDDASDWTNSGNLNPIFFWLYDFTSTRTAGQIALSWTPNLFATGYEIDCATYDPNAAYNPTYTRCDTLTNQDDTDATHTATITTWTANSKNYSIDNTKHYDIRICSTHANGRACFLAPMIDPYVPPSLTASSVTSTGATLTVANHIGKWRYKETFPSTTATCSAANTGATATLSSLTADKTYAYTVYSDSACSSGKAFGTVYFSTTDAFAGNLGTATGEAPSVGANSSGIQYQQAVAFTTGLTGITRNGYTLKNVTLAFDDKTGSPANILVALHEVDTTDYQKPPKETAFATLTGSNPDTEGLYTYTCSGSNCDLARNTTYFIVVSAPYSPKGAYYTMQMTTSDDETRYPTVNGWTIANKSLESDGIWWFDWSNNSTAVLHVAANEKPSSVSNLAETASSNSPTTINWVNNIMRNNVANSFTTGSNTLGYTLNNIQARFAAKTGGPGDLTVEILSDTSGSPGSSVASLTGTDPGAAGDYTFACFGTCDLSASTKYWVVMHSASGGHSNGLYNLTWTASNNQAGSAGWSIGDVAKSGTGSTFSSVSWSAVSPAESFMFAVNASEKRAQLTAGNISNTRATLTIADHTTQWWYKANAAPHTSCQGPVAANTASKALTGLTVNTSYTYTAYSATGCASAALVATAPTFRTPTSAPALTVRDHSAIRTPYLNLANYTGIWHEKEMYPSTTATCGLANTGIHWLPSLTANKTYVYTAYSDDACSTANALATAYFSTTDVAAGNLAEARESANWSVGGTTNVKRANAFTTGANDGGYVLQGVTLAFAAKTSSPGDISVALHAADTTNSSNPASSAVANATLTGSDPDTAGLYTYTCAGSGCDLARNTTYFIVTSVPTGYANGSYQQQNTTADAEALQPSGNGWSIANAGRSKTGAAAWAAATQSAAMHVFANEVPPELTATTTSTGATLTLANHIGNWYHKETHPSTTATCSTVNTGATVSLTTLTANTLYGYTAYSDSACSTTTALDTLYFSTTDAFVGNLGAEAHPFPASLSSSYGKQAISFTTGNAATGYALENVTIEFSDKDGSPSGNIVVALHEADTTNSSNPKDTALATLTGSNPDTAGLYTYACAGSGCDLARNTTYFIVMSAPSVSSDSYEMLVTESADETPYPATGGWSIADEGRSKEDTRDWRSSFLGAVPILHIAANELPPSLTASSVTTTTATLTLLGHTGNWYLKKIAPTAGTCSSAITGTTHNLTTLTAGTWHTYKAYSDSNCSSANELAAEVFSTTMTTSSMDANSGSTIWIGRQFSSTQAGAQAFTTGPNSGGYTLASITGLFTQSIGTPGDIAVKLYNASGANPGTELATLSGDNPTAAGQYAYTCSGSGCALAANTTYFLVVNTPNVPATGSHRYLWNITASDSETNVPTGNGWSVANDGRYSPTSNLSSWSSSGGTYQIKVAALPKPSLTASSVAGTTATVTLTGHVGDWWLKKTAPTPAGTCAAGESDFSHALSSLTAGTWHTYKAYSNSTCSSANEIAAEVFTTTVTVSNLDTSETSFTSVGSYTGTLWQTGQAFTTGSNESGYTLSSIAGRFDAVSGTPGDIVVKLHAASGTNPGTALATLSGDNPTTAGVFTYTCSGNGCALAANTTYLVVMSAPDATASNRYYWRSTTSNTQTLEPASNGWSIGSAAVAKSDNVPWYTIGRAGQIKVTALAKPGLDLSSVSFNGTTATVTLTGHVGDWWLKKTAPTPAGSCTAGEADFSHALSSLTAGTSYTYKAYSDSACSTANEIGSATFTPPSGVPTSVSVGGSNINGSHRIYPVSWNKPANTLATDSFAYQLQCTDQNNRNTTNWSGCGTHNISSTANTSMSQNVQHGWQGGLFYYVRVRTVKNSEYSAWVIQKTQYGS